MSELEASREQNKQVAIDKRTLLSDFVLFATYLTKQKWNYKYVRYILSVLTRPNIFRFTISLPPRHYKSTLVQIYALFWLIKNPGKAVCFCSCTQDLSLDFVRHCRRIIQGEEWKALFPDLTLTKDSEGQLILSNFSEIRAHSVGSNIFGRNSHLTIIDDPIKPSEINSVAIRKKAEDWYYGEVLTRQETLDSPIIIIGSRLGTSDFIGKRLSEGYFEINIPAISVSDNMFTAPALSELHLGVPLLKPMEFYLTKRTEVKDFVFCSQFLQQPIPQGDLMLDPDLLPLVNINEIPPKAELKQIRSWDLGFSSGGDSTIGCLIGCSRTFPRKYYIFGQVEIKTDIKNLVQRMKAVILADGQNILHLVESNNAGIAIINSLKQDPELQGYTIKGVLNNESKLERAEPWVTEIKLNDDPNIKAVVTDNKIKDEWIDKVKDQLRGFSCTYRGGKADDRIDSISQGYNYLHKLIIQLPIK